MAKKEEAWKGQETLLVQPSSSGAGMGLFSKYSKVSGGELGLVSVALGLNQDRRVPRGKFGAPFPNDFAKNPNYWKMGLASWQSNERLSQIYSNMQRLS